MPEQWKWLVSAAIIAFATATLVKAYRSRQSGRYVFSTWDGGLALRGKDISARLMMFVGATLIIITVVLHLRNLYLKQPEFIFAVPSGWIELSKDAPAANFERIPPTLAEFARAQQHKVQALAVEVGDADDFAVYSAEEVNRAPVLSIALLDEVIGTAFRKPAPQDAVVDIRDKRIISHGQHQVGSITASMTMDGTRTDSRTFVVVGQRHYAVLLCVAPEKSFSRCSAALDDVLARLLPQTPPSNGG